MKQVTLLIIFSLLTHAQVKASDQIDLEKNESETIGTCDPIVNVVVNQKLRSEVLKELGEKYDFKVQVPEPEDSIISMEKEDSLSNVIESITRSSSVSLRYKKKDNCKQLAEIIFLKNQQWSGFEAQDQQTKTLTDPEIPPREITRERIDPTTGRILGPRSKSFQFEFIPKKVTQSQLEEEMYMNEEKQKLQEKREKAIQADRERVEEKRRVAAERNNATYQPEIKINNIIPGGDNLTADYYAEKNDWKENPKSRYETNNLDVENMDRYVREVLNGERVPKGEMNAKERFEYFRALKRIQTNK